MEDQAEVDRRYFKSTVPSRETQPLFDEAKKLGIGFYLIIVMIERVVMPWHPSVRGMS